ncbi:hypothetical protein B2J93_3426 [Marssonina coronariae]|uniref:2EXR domain-containing protein n=1 Tax=Diplocarpon coronariae TaxID=2795749 RepID=A0A218Z251_9HELO|nr:hypothetical protein B2J93_3426 [Marssonina coronariae]
MCSKHQFNPMSSVNPVLYAETPVYKCVTFTVFRALPLELRNMVWELALPEGRILEMKYFPGEFSRDAAIKQAHGSVANISRACSEARTIVMKRYQKTHVEHVGHTGTARHLNPQYLVDYATDIHYFPHTTLEVPLTLITPDEIENWGKIKKIALAISSSAYGSAYMTADEFAPENFGILRSLEEIIFVADEERFFAGMKQIDSELVNKDFDDIEFAGVDTARRTPLVRLDLEVEAKRDPVYLCLIEDQIRELKGMLGEKNVSQAYEGIKVSLEVWRRPCDEFDD